MLAKKNDEKQNNEDEENALCVIVQIQYQTFIERKVINN